MNVNGRELGEYEFEIEIYKQLVDNQSKTIGKLRTIIDLQEQLLKMRRETCRHLRMMNNIALFGIASLILLIIIFNF